MLSIPFNVLATALITAMGAVYVLGLQAATVITTLFTPPVITGVGTSPVERVCPCDYVPIYWDVSKRQACPVIGKREWWQVDGVAGVEPLQSRLKLAVTQAPKTVGPVILQIPCEGTQPGPLTLRISGDMNCGGQAMSWSFEPIMFHVKRPLECRRGR